MCFVFVSLFVFVVFCFWFCLFPNMLWLLLLISHMQRMVLATEETTVTQQRVSHRPTKCQSLFSLWSRKGTKVNGPHNGDNPLLRPTAIQIATKSLSGPTNREHRKLIGVKTMSLGTNYTFYCLEWCAASIL